MNGKRGDLPAGAVRIFDTRDKKKFFADLPICEDRRFCIIFHQYAENGSSSVSEIFTMPYGNSSVIKVANHSSTTAGITKDDVTLVTNRTELTEL